MNAKPLKKSVFLVLFFFIFVSMQLIPGVYGLNTVCAATEVEPNDNFDQAQNIQPSSTISGQLGFSKTSGGLTFNDNRDVFKVVLTADGVLNVALSYDSTIKSVRTSATNGKGVGFGDFDNYGNKSFNFGAGTYYVEVNCYGGSGNYTLTTLFTPDGHKNDNEPNDQFEQANDMVLNSSVQGHIGYWMQGNGVSSLDNRDTFKFVLPSKGDLTLTMSYDSTIKEVRTSITNGKGVGYGSFDNYGSKKFEQLEAGTYYIDINNYGYGYGGYTLSNTFTSSGGQTPVQTTVPTPTPYQPVPTPTPAGTTGGTLFEDSFSRYDSGDLGSNWKEYKIRNGTGGVPASGGPGDTPWSIKNNTLYYEYTGDNSYTEDFIETVQEFPVDNTRVEFEIRAKAGTMLGYVGPAALWATGGENRNNLIHVKNGINHIGVQAWYRWENKGTKGVIVHNNGEYKDNPDSTFAGLNQDSFARHVIIVKDGKVTYQSPSMGEVSYNLYTPLKSGETRDFSFGVRLYDSGVPQVVEIKNLKITSLGGTQVTSNQTVTYPNTSSDILRASLKDGKVYLEWNASSETGIVGYNLYRATSSGAYTSTPVTDFPIKNTYYYDAKALDGYNYYIMKPVFSNGKTGAQSNEAVIYYSKQGMAATGKKSIELQLGNPYMTVNGKTTEIDPGRGTVPAMVDDRVLVPVRAIVESLGGTAAWDGDTEKITIEARNAKIEMWLNQNSIRVNNSDKTIDVPPQTINERTMVPVRFVTENLNCNVKWDGENNKVIIEYD